mmetsp:Transcript_25241/g.24163  ORF Transcript_25241/g.24163 Transcript_25241/m.24163 type:complete len:196 (-) Transcript_25241:75-662(-)
MKIDILEMELQSAEKRVNSKTPRGDLYYHLDLIENAKVEKVQSIRRPATTNSLRSTSHLKSNLLDPLSRSSPSRTPDIDGNKHIASINTGNGSEKPRKNSSVYFQPQAAKKKSIDIFKVDADKVRRKCNKEFQASWMAKERIGGYGERPGGSVQLLNDEPIRFWSKDMEREPFNVKLKQLKWYDQIKQDAKKGIK